MKTLSREGLLAIFGGLLVLLVTGCGPSYPECHEDEDCAEQDEYCVNAQCSQCRDDSHCTASMDESYVCESGSCQKIQGYCKNPDFKCPGKQACRDPLTNQLTEDNAAGRCGVQCLDDTECENGWICKEGVCTEPLECTVDADCPDGKICKNNRCIEPPVCQPRQIYFDFDESYIRNSEKSTLDNNVDCYNERSIASVEITGHCDERGTEEYNMALGERRAKETRKYMKKKGVKDIDTRSRGEYDLVVPNARTEAEHQKNRRAEFVYGE